MNDTIRGLLIAAIMVGLAACASEPKPSVRAYPDQGKQQDGEQMAADEARCRTRAKNESGFDPRGDTAKETAKGAVIGGAIGAAAGAAIGAAAGSPGTGAAVGAGVGATAGGAIAGTKEHQKGQDAYDRVYAACMKELGYTVW